MDYSQVLDFWFSELDSAQWFKKDPKLDQMIKDRFQEVHNEAKQSALFKWRQTPEGRLAEIIVLDQFSRNMYRNQPESFAQDPLALALSQEAVGLELHKKLNGDQAFFLIMPYMHSESLKVHDEALTLFADVAPSTGLDFEKKHRDIIVRFGRYPHRNTILGRQSSSEEQAFLNEPNSSF